MNTKMVSALAMASLLASGCAQWPRGDGRVAAAPDPRIKCEAGHPVCHITVRVIDSTVRDNAGHGLGLENGELTYAVSEVTIAGHLLDIFKSMIPANDLEFKYGVNAPTVRIEGLTIAGR